MKRIVKPSGPCVKKLAELYPASKQTPVKQLGMAFDPLQECVALPAKRMKKSTKIKPVCVEVFVLPPPILPRGKDLILPRGKKRQEMIRDGRVKTLQIKRTMSPLQVRNCIILGFKHLNLQTWEFLGVSGGKLVKLDNQTLGGELVDRRGALYLQEKVDT